jgi:hypothetical protein
MRFPEATTRRVGDIARRGEAFVGQGLERGRATKEFVRHAVSVRVSYLTRTREDQVARARERLEDGRGCKRR